jgi:phosphatidate cytidylyltransferase
MMLKRWISALVLLAIVFVVIWFGDPAFSIFIAVAAALAVLEFYGMRGLPKKHILTILGLIGVLAFMAIAHIDCSYAKPALTAVVALPLIWLLVRPPARDTAFKLAWALTGVIYIGWMLSHFIPLRELAAGRDWVFLALFTNIATDTTAFFVGSAWGRRHLAPKISAGKTWEGTVAGFLAAIAAAVLMAAVLPGLEAVPYWQAVVLGILIGIFAQLGDLTESMFKRSAGLKDSGTMIPGHGGILDRLDSILFTGVVTYYYVIFVVM